jgi:2-C-methyl-D-erythritol 4-phosphate cytidylyltransferase
MAAFTPLAGEPALLRVIRALLGAEMTPNRIIVAAAEPLAERARELLEASQLSSVGVVIGPGPGTRAHLLSAALEVLADESVSPQSVLVADTRQPLTSTELCARVIAHLGDAVVLPMQPVTDSVKAVDPQGSVAHTLDRSTLRAVQYPRGYPIEMLTRFLAVRASDHFDEVAETLRARLPVTTVEGDPVAFAAELPRDTRFVEAVIASARQPDL